MRVTPSAQPSDRWVWAKSRGDLAATRRVNRDQPFMLLAIFARAMVSAAPPSVFTSPKCCA